MCRSKSLADALLEFFNALKTRCSETYDRTSKAQSVRQKALRLKVSFKAVKGDDFTCYYLHAAEAHLPAQILESDFDVFEASGCAIEHLHKSVKHNFQ